MLSSTSIGRRAESSGGCGPAISTRDLRAPCGSAEGDAARLPEAEESARVGVVAEMCRVLSIDPAELPVIWEADFMYGRTGNRRDVCPKERRRPCDITAEKLV